MTHQERTDWATRVLLALIMGVLFIEAGAFAFIGGCVMGAW